MPSTACSKASLPLSPTGSSTVGPGCSHPSPQQSYFQLLAAGAATLTPQGEEPRSPACVVSGDSGCHLPLGVLGSSGSPQAVAAWCMARGSLPALAPTLPILSWQQHGGTGNSSFLCKPFPGPVCVPLGGPHQDPEAGLSSILVHPPVPWPERGTSIPYLARGFLVVAGAEDALWLRCAQRHSVASASSVGWPQLAP